MRLLVALAAVLSTFLSTTFCSAHQSTAGVQGILQRRFPNHVDDFTFSLVNTTTSNDNNTTPLSKPLDHYTVLNGPHPGEIHISGTSSIALATGLRWYLTTYCHVDLWWSLGPSQLPLLPAHLPPLNSTHYGSSVVPWRYHFNTVTFSYTTPWWGWEDWERELDWLALRGVNLPLAWVGYEKILLEVLIEAGLEREEVQGFLAGPGFQAWNRLGNIQDSWGGRGSGEDWIEAQFALQKKIVARMVELGMTPALPAFTGFVPRGIQEVYPDARIVNGSRWNGFPDQYTNVTFLEPFDPLFARLQESFLAKQKAALGDVSHIYTLDQYNENDPYSGDLEYLHNITSTTIASLKAADPEAIWLLQGWLFYSSEDFWTNDRIAAYLGGVADADMLILDLFSESQPQWQRTGSYYGKPWIWCQLHDYGGNMGLYGQVENVTADSVKALGNESSTMVGMGLTMEGQEGNEIMYDLLLDQAWSRSPLDTAQYFRHWVSVRYHESLGCLPQGLYKAWDIMRGTVYNNTELDVANAVTKSIFVLSPNTTGLLNRTGHHATTVQYEPEVLVEAWKQFYAAADEMPGLWENDAYRFDLTDITRQVMANAFYPLYTTFLTASNTSQPSTYNITTARHTGETLLRLLKDLDTILTASGIAHFSLPAWIASARAWADPSPLLSATTHPQPTNPSSPAAINTTALTDRANFYEYNARNQITLWGPRGEISDYASKQWGGLIGSYYLPRWQMFVDFILGNNGSSEPAAAAAAAAGAGDGGLVDALRNFELEWQGQRWGERVGEGFEVARRDALQREMGRVLEGWAGDFGL
ncbi:hypothetical protein D0864_08970 [Hortaea werneckii]|uniref:Alpha-N-acetylglucosaminidase n=1 Tax=Hortaea werneckii TaxID=91943 RepID=A0A3M7ET78_HORWE|nr:hypothetical protein KC338_g8953 [Hortaea werneckii]KAI7570786.1 hypothetical protein KC317_g2181 [Hortaea werneckii]KAI7617012.1 hypothetical protein KC346_g5698 [Hortaea werneckii]KAI7678974.1 hypothetical protein KC319_g3015 [Hortaea werneckii]KAI7715062.1 hypothetical protein KC322_g3026 [Hortaea werneckii]